MGNRNSRSVKKDHNHKNPSRPSEPSSQFSDLPFQNANFKGYSPHAEEKPNPSKNQAQQQNPSKKQKSRQANYEIFDTITYEHQMKQYKKPNAQKQKSQQYDIYAPRIDIYSGNKKTLAEIDSDQYLGADFSNKDYLNSIPKKKSAKGVKFDETKTMFFRAGHAPVYSESLLVLQSHNDAQTMWMDIEDPSYCINQKVNYAKNHIPFALGSYERKYVMQAGWFVMMGNKWGFLLNLDSITEAYQGHLHKRWKVLLQQPFFLDMVERFGGYMEDLQTQMQGGDKGVLPREIPTTDFDPFLNEGFIWKGLHDQLFLHQKQEVGWMFNLENYPALRMKKKQNAMPFLDTGYYIDPNNLTEFLNPDSTEDFIDIIVPGGILASQIGSGKTVTVIALTSIGYQLKDEKKKDSEYYEESKFNDLITKGGDMKMMAKNPQNVKKKLTYLMGEVYEPTLIIVTENILKQWEEEYRRFAPKLKVKVVENEKDLLDLKFKTTAKGRATQLLDYDVILTHRAIIERGTEIFRKHCPGIFTTSFRRVIMDEFHELTTYMTDQALASQQKNNVVQLKHNMLEFYRTLSKIDRRFTWGITGTPDSLNYFYEADPLFKLLNLNQQYNKTSTFFKMKDEFVSTCMRKNPRSVDLPGLNKSVINVFFGQLQNILYKGKLNYALDKKAAQEICSHLMKQWQQLEAGGKDYIQAGIEAIRRKHQEEIMLVERLMKERVEKDDTYNILKTRLETLRHEGNFFGEVINLLSQNKFECPVCLVDFPINDLVITECLHNLCASCWDNLQRVIHNPQCPVCREFVQNSGVVIHPKFAETKENKLTAIMKALEATPHEDKVIIFTQFQSLVEHLTETFMRLDIPYIVLRGSPSEINMSLTHFKYNPQIKVLLMSVEQAASGINVQEANHVFFAHPIFGMEFEKAAITYNQCIGRAYRIGQMKDVNVKLFVTVDSLEVDLVPSFNKYGDPLK